MSEKTKTYMAPALFITHYADGKHRVFLSSELFASKEQALYATLTQEVDLYEWPAKLDANGFYEIAISNDPWEW